MTALSGPERLVLTIVAAACLAFAVLTPPFQAPDEPQHLSRARALAHGRPFAEHRAGMVGGEEPAGYARLSERDFPREAFDVPVRDRPADVARGRSPAGRRGYSA